MTASSAIDTNVLVHRHDPSDPVRQRRATEFVRAAVRAGDVALPWQALTEFVSATTRQRKGAQPLLSADEARDEASVLAAVFPVLLPDVDVFHTAVAGAARHRLPWWDAVIWAYAERAGVPTLYTEDFADGRVIGGVRIVDPFR